MARTYTVTATRRKRGWELHIDDVGVTQSRTLSTAEQVVRGYVETLTGHDLSGDTVVITPELGGLGDRVAAVQSQLAAADRQREEAQQAERQLASDLRAAGLSAADAAVVLGTSRGPVPRSNRVPDGSPTGRAITVTRRDSRAASEPIVRDYAERDYPSCRSLWTELTEHHRRIYADPSIGGDDPGSGFDSYLTTPQLAGIWVAEHRGEVVGMTGLFDRGTNGEVEPVVVTEAARAQGIGHLLISRAVEEARARAYEYLAIRPVARNVAAIRRFHAEGFHMLGGHVDLTMDLAPRRHEWLPGATLHGLDFEY